MKKSKTKENQCEICENSHNHTIILECGHYYGISCLLKIFKKKFLRDKFYLPQCQITECKCFLNLNDLEKILKDEFSAYYSTCRNCEMISFKCIFIKLTNCLHRLCLKCFEEILDEKTFKIVPSDY